MPARLAPAEGQENQRRAWLLRQQFRTQEQIAEELGVTQQAVSRMLQREARRQAAIFENQALEIKAAQTAQLEQVAREAYLAWLRSQEDAEQSRTKAIRAPAPEKAKSLPNLGTRWPGEEGGDEEGDDAEDRGFELDAGEFEPPLIDTEVVSVRKGQAGNPAFLAQVREALADIRKIWGIDAPLRQDVTLNVLMRVLNDLRSMPESDLLDVLGYATDALPEHREA